MLIIDELGLIPVDRVGGELLSYLAGSTSKCNTVAK
jgi:hypothetical protein